MQSKIDGPYRPPANGAKPEKLVIMLHGVGADGNDLIDLATPLGGLFPNVGFASPHAPEPYDMAPMGRQWFSLMDRDPDKLLAGAQAASPVLSAYIDELKTTHGLQDSDIALLGFSQGTMMSLYHAPRRAGQLAGVLGYSGALIGGGTLDTEATSKPPILLIHGEADPVVPFIAMGAAAQALSTAGFTVNTLARPNLGHGIDPEGLQAGAAFLKSVL